MSRRPRAFLAAAVTVAALLTTTGVPAATAQPVDVATPPPAEPTPPRAESTQPAPDTRADAAVEAPGMDLAGADEDLLALARLSAEAGVLGEELHLAREELDAADRDRGRLERVAGVAAGRAAAADGAAVRDQSVVDHLATMRYRGGDTGATRAAVLAESPQDLVTRLGALQRLSGATTSALEASRAASAEATRLRHEAERAAEDARAAAADARSRADELDRRADQMRVRMDEVRSRVDALTDAQRALWAGGPALPPGYVAPPVDGVNSAALRAALTRVGSPYSWGATGPSQFDCSGLMVWAYAQEGKTLPRSSQMQSGAGAPVAIADIRPGDLVIYYPGATHVGMYAGDGLVLHASGYGIPVKLDPVDSMPVHSVRRY